MHSRDRRAFAEAASANGHNTGRIRCVHGGTVTGAGGGSRDQSLQLIDEARGRGDLQSTRPDERADEACTAVSVRSTSFERRREVVGVFVERTGRAEHSVGVVQQIVKVDRAFLALGELRQEDRMDRPADDRPLDHGAGVQADDDVRMVQRIEVVGLRLGIRRGISLQRPTRRAGESVETDVSPFASAPEVRPYEDAAVSQQRVPARSKVLCPADDERSLGCAPFQKGRTHIQHDRAIRSEAYDGRKNRRASSMVSSPNHSSKTCEPVTTTSSAVSPCH